MIPFTVRFKARLFAPFCALLVMMRSNYLKLLEESSPHVPLP
jgi:hypothetical protein